MGYNECNEVYQDLSVAASKLDSVTESGLNNDNYGECLSKIAEKMKSAVPAVVALNTVARSGDMERLAKKIVEVCPSNTSYISVGEE